MKNVIHIFGAAGSGTTTLGKKICEELGYKHMDTDDYFWLPTEPRFMMKRPREERIELMTRDINNHENVVISGSLTDWGDVLIPRFTLAVRIEMDQDIRIERLIRRERQRNGSRIEPGGDLRQKYLDFVAWAKAYDTGGMDMRSKFKHDDWQRLLTCELLLLDGADTVAANFTKVKNILDFQNQD